jgi:heme-degrading monooxygenase HmoA
VIARMWRGLVRTEAVDEYVDIVERTGMSGYRRTPGNAGAQQMTRDLGEGRTEIVTMSWWSSLDDIRAFAGDDISVARYYPEDDAYLVDRDESVAHYEVASQSGASADGRFDPREIAEAFSSRSWPRTSVGRCPVRLRSRGVRRRSPPVGRPSRSCAM